MFSIGRVWRRASGGAVMDGRGKRTIALEEWVGDALQIVAGSSVGSSSRQ